MHVTFDIDGTITANPVMFGEIMKTLRSAGHRVTVLTGAWEESRMVEEEKIRQLLMLQRPIKEGEHYDELVLIRGKDGVEIAKSKGDWCRLNGVDAMFDNEHEAVFRSRTRSPQTACFLVAA